MDVSFGFLVKKTLVFLFEPLTICFLFFALGLVQVVLRRAKESATPFVLGTLLLYLLALNSFSGYLIRPLERAYKPLNLQSTQVTARPIAFVVVLGSGHWTDATLPATSMLDASALYRLTEGIRVANHLPGATLVLSGGAYRDKQTCAQVMANAARELGFDPTRIRLSPESLDTHDEARNIKALVGDKPFILVTSATHMLRAMKLFQNQGLSPIPAPTQYHDKGRPERFLPDVNNIRTCQIAVHEYLGLAWSLLRGQIAFESL